MATRALRQLVSSQFSVKPQLEVFRPSRFYLNLTGRSRMINLILFGVSTCHCWIIFMRSDCFLRAKLIWNLDSFSASYNVHVFFLSGLRPAGLKDVHNNFKASWTVNVLLIICYIENSTFSTFFRFSRKSVLRRVKTS